MGSVYATFVQKVTADIPHDAGFAADPDPATAGRERELSHHFF
jgi:hypothetical protein